MKRLILAILLLTSLSWAGYTKRATVSWNIPPASTLTHYPAMVYISDATLKSTGNGGVVTNASGFDIVAFSDTTCTTKLTFDRAAWDGTNGAILFFVDIASFASSSPAPIYICYGNSAVTTEQAAPTTVWANANYKAVWHFGVGSLSANTSTSATNINFSSMASGTCGTSVLPLVCAVNLTGTNSITGGLNTGNDIPVGANIRTMEVWFKFLSNPNASTDNVIVGYGGTSADAPFSFDYYTGTFGGCVGTLFAAYVARSNPYNCIPISTNTWHLAVMTVPSGAAENTIAMYFDGVAKSLTGGAVNTLNTLSIGTNRLNGAPSGASFTAGVALSEYRIANVVQSNDWEVTNYANQNSPGTFETISISAVGTVANPCMFLICTR